MQEDVDDEDTETVGLHDNQVSLNYTGIDMHSTTDSHVSRIFITE